MKTLAEQWADLEAKILPPNGNFGEIQRGEMKKAFYAGAFAVLTMAYDLGATEISEAEGADRLEKLWQEAVAFAESLKTADSKTEPLQSTGGLNGVEGVTDRKDNE